MLTLFKNAWKVKDIRKKLLYIIMILIVVRVGAHIPWPGLDIYAINDPEANPVIQGFFQLMTGGAGSQFTLFAMGIGPYITSSIIMQLLCVAIPKLEQLKKEGETGRKKIQQYSRYLTIILAALQGSAMVFNFRELFLYQNFFVYAMAVVALMAGTTFVMWLGEQINEKGIGNGSSMLIFVNILTALPAGVGMFYNMIIGGIDGITFANTANQLQGVIEYLPAIGAGSTNFFASFAGLSGFAGLGHSMFFDVFNQTAAAVDVVDATALSAQMSASASDALWSGIWSLSLVVILLVIFTAIITFVVFIQDGERRVPVQYSKKMVGRRLMGGQSSFIPIKINVAGVISIIFAISLLQFPQTVAGFFGQAEGWWSVLATNHWFGALLYAVLIIFFTYFYTSMVFNPNEIADNMKKNGGFIPGIRPGQPTSAYLSKVSGRITFFGAIVYMFVAILPIIMEWIFGIPIGFGGTTVIIVVGTALELVKQIESQLLMRHYKGFLNS